MDAIGMMSGLNIKQNKASLFRTQTEVDRINKMIENDGKKPTKELGKDEFLQLLITELQHQDPTNPMNDREFIAQMAQFSSLEQMLNFNNGMTQLIDNVSFQNSFNLIGMQVDIEGIVEGPQGAETGITDSGMVQAVSKKGNQTFVRVNGEEYPVSSIMNVKKN